MAGIYYCQSELDDNGRVEVIEPNQQAYFIACLKDIDETGKMTLVR
jgi:hypothetical protein